MKKLFRLAILVVAVVAASACKKTEEPSAIAEKYLNHLNKMEIDEAKKFATKETGAQLDLLKTMLGDQKPEGEIKPVTIKDTKIDGDKATCTYSDGEKEESINLVKVEGEWKVEWKKENPMGGDAGMSEAPSDSTATPATEEAAKTEESKQNAQ
ncbi:MAG: hypothetical protein WCK02_13940 [Bacteroidota bacterium]